MKKLNDNIVIQIENYNNKINMDENPNEIEMFHIIRGIVEAMIEEINADKGKAIKALFERGIEMEIEIEEDYLYFIINSIHTTNHGKIMNGNSLSATQRQFETFWSIASTFFKSDIEIEFKTNSNNDEIKLGNNRVWKKREYKALIVSNRKFDSEIGKFYYSVANSTEKNGYNQKDKHRIYVDNEVMLATGETYSIKCNLSEIIVNGEPLGIEIIVLSEYRYEQSPFTYANSELNNLRNNFVKEFNRTFIYSMFSVKYIEISYGVKFSKYEEYIDEFFRIIKEMGFGYDLIQNLAYLKKPNQSIEKEIFRRRKKIKETSPMLYEFWTKNPNGAKFSLNEKDIMYEIFTNIKLNNWNEEFKKSKRNNEVKYLELMENEEVHFEINEDESFIDLFPKNNFNSGFEEKKIEPTKILEKDVFMFNNEKRVLDAIIEKSMSKINLLIENFKKEDFDNLNAFDQENNYIDIANETLKSPLNIIDGAAGTGKTTLCSILANKFSDEYDEVHYIAPTHIAKELLVKKMKEMKFDTSKIISSTCASFREIINEKNRVIFIDEYSMISTKDWYEKIMINLDKFDRVYIIGDEFQLPPINSTQLGKIFPKALQKNVHTLEKNYRQSSEQTNRQFLTKLRNGEKIKNPAYISEYSGVKEFIDFFKTESYISSNTTVLTPNNGGIYGVKNINRLFGKTDLEFKVSDALIIQKTISVDGNESFIYNNRPVRVTKIIDEKVYVNIQPLKNKLSYENDYGIGEDDFWFVDVNGEFYFKINEEALEDSKLITHSTAMTIHKSQGSTLENVVVVVPPGYNMDWKMLYTAASRAGLQTKILIHKKDYNKYFEK